VKGKEWNAGTAFLPNFRDKIVALLF